MPPPAVPDMAISAAQAADLLRQLDAVNRENDAKLHRLTRGLADLQSSMGLPPGTGAGDTVSSLGAPGPSVSSAATPLASLLGRVPTTADPVPLDAAVTVAPLPAPGVIDSHLDPNGKDRAHESEPGRGGALDSDHSLLTASSTTVMGTECETQTVAQAGSEMAVQVPEVDDDTSTAVVSPPPPPPIPKPEYAEIGILTRLPDPRMTDLQKDNAHLLATLKEYESTLELIMAKFRSQVQAAQAVQSGLHATHATELATERRRADALAVDRAAALDSLHAAHAVIRESLRLAQEEDGDVQRTLTAAKVEVEVLRETVVLQNRSLAAVSSVAAAPVVAAPVITAVAAPVAPAVDIPPSLPTAATTSTTAAAAAVPETSSAATTHDPAAIESDDATGMDSIGNVTAPVSLTNTIVFATPPPLAASDPLVDTPLVSAVGRPPNDGPIEGAGSEQGGEPPAYHHMPVLITDDGNDGESIGLAWAAGTGTLSRSGPSSDPAPEAAISAAIAVPGFPPPITSTAAAPTTGEEEEENSGDGWSQW
ncbi:hypothetical protein BC828DRAFT_405694 [Blastocladiella britannica]|nr:hypothetical protein BC828DRAFT_405694 [Blastocladiella britannica]